MKRIFWETEYGTPPLHKGPKRIAENYVEPKEGEIIGEGLDDEGRYIYRYERGEKVKVRIPAEG